MSEIIPSQKQFELPNTDEQTDVITLGKAGKLSGAIAHWTLDGTGVPQIQHTAFEADSSKFLTPFSYKKPEVTNNDPFNPQEGWETKQREGYVPLVIVKKSYRGPNHWHREDDAVACAVLNGAVWETRYFPKANIPPETWEEALKILGEQEV